MSAKRSKLYQTDSKSVMMEKQRNGGEHILMIGILSVYGMLSVCLSVCMSVCLSVCLSGEYTYDWDSVCLRDAIVDIHEEDDEGEHGRYGQCDLLTRLRWNQERTSKRRELSAYYKKA